MVSPLVAMARRLFGSEAVGPLVMIRAGTRVAAPPQRGTTRIGALGEGRPPIGIGSTDRPRLLLRGELGVNRLPNLTHDLECAVGAGRGCGDGASAGWDVIVGSGFEAPGLLSSF